MAKIEDFGNIIPGAAKHMRGGINDRDRNYRTLTLDTAFPELDWIGLVGEGIPPRNIALARAMRDNVGTKPRHSHRVAEWARIVYGLNNLATLLCSRNSAADTYDRAIEIPGMKGLMRKARLYQEVGHARSLKRYTVGETNDGQLQLREDGMTLATANSWKELADKTNEDLDKSKNTSRPKVSWYTRKGKPGEEHPCMILAKTSAGQILAIEGCASEKEAIRLLRTDRERLIDLVIRMRDIPSERYETNEPRQGPDRLDGDITAEDFSDTFSLRGVQFGASMPFDQRQSELNATAESFLDLAEAIGVQPADVSLDGDLAIAFGARGKGGVNAAKAHYEPDLRVINLTRRNGAGSLAHEWYHAWDRVQGGGDSYASVRNYEVHNDLRAAFINTGLIRRSEKLDQVKGRHYWRQLEEMAARSFEAWIKDRLEARGIVNDYLVNVIDEEDWADRDYHGKVRYPYPLKSELPAFDKVFSEMFQVEPNAVIWAKAAESAPVDNVDPAVKSDLPEAVEREPENRKETSGIEQETPEKKEERKEKEAASWADQISFDF